MSFHKVEQSIQSIYWIEGKTGRTMGSCSLARYFSLFGSPCGGSGKHKYGPIHAGAREECEKQLKMTGLTASYSKPVLRNL